MEIGANRAVTTIRADFQDRLPRRSRRSFGIVRDARGAWRLSWLAWRKTPIVFAAALLGWTAIRFVCLRGLAQAHVTAGGRLTLPQVATLLALALIADLGPLVLAAMLWPLQHRMILDVPAPGLRASAARSARMFGTALLLAFAGAAALALPLWLPDVLLPALGRVSTALSLILVLPGVVLALLALLRLSFGLPAISLGLPRAMAEGWEIGRFHTWRAACVWLVATLPATATLAGLVSLGPDRLGWAAALVRPVLDVVFVSLTGALTALFYRSMRLPLGLRPDVRPSWNLSRRREPII